MRKNNKKKILPLLAGLLAALVVADLGITLLFAHKIPHRFASIQEGRERLLAHTDYYAQFTQSELDLRLKKTGATLEELLRVSAEEIQAYSFFEKYYIDHELAKMALKCAWKGYTLPETEEIVFVKSEMSVDMGNTGYTHGSEIYLNGTSVTIYSLLRVIPGFSTFFDELLWHEYFHCLSRANPGFREEMYALIHFSIAEADFPLPPCVRERRVSNPDVEHHDAYAPFLIEGREVNCFTVWITDGADKTVALVPIDGTDTYYTRDQAANFDAIFGTNTHYVIDPEECMADNFAYALFYGPKGKDGKGYPNPEIIAGVLEAVSPH